MNDREHWIKYFYNLVLIHAPHTGVFYGDFLKNEIDFNDIQLHKYREYASESYDALRADGLIQKVNLLGDTLTSKGVQESLRLINLKTPNTTNTILNNPNKKSKLDILVALVAIASGLILIYEFIIKSK